MQLKPDQHYRIEMPSIVAFELSNVTSLAMFLCLNKAILFCIQRNKLLMM